MTDLPIAYGSNHPEPDVSVNDPYRDQSNDDLASEPSVDDKFWTARPELDHVRAYARSHMCSPWATLAVVLVRAVVAVPPFVVLPNTVGGHATLNMFAVLIGPPGAGKDAAISCAGDAVRFDSVSFPTVPLGSGEGIAHAYMRATRDGVEQHTTACMFTVSEIDTLAALHRRQGSTVVPQLRQAWMGERLGFQYADTTRRLLVPPHRYRLGLVGGAQPTRAGILLDDKDGGTPQRFLWLPATDPDAPDETPEPPEPLALALPRPPVADAYSHRSVLPVCGTAVDAIREVRRTSLRGNSDSGLNGHALLQRLKVAAALGLLAGRMGVTDDDWELAAVIMARSDRTRDRVVAALQRVKAEQNRGRAEAEADRAVIVNDRMRKDTVARVSRTIGRRLHREPDWQPLSALRRSCTSADRAYFDDAVDALLEAGQVELDDTGRGTRIRLSERVR